MTTTENTLAGALARMAENTRDQTVMAAQNCKAERRFRQIGEGKGHPLWLIGHLANTADFLGNRCGLGLEPIVPKPWRQKFTPPDFGGDPIANRPEDYPPWDEVLEVYKQAMTRFRDALAEVGDAEMPGPCKGAVPERLTVLIPTIEAMAARVLLHDSHHRGQLAMLACAPD